MTVTLGKEHLKNVLEVAKMGLASSDLIPILQTFKIEGDKITTYNDLLAVTVNVEENLTDNPVCVKGQSLLNFTKKTNNDYVNLSLDQGQVSSGNTTMGLESQDPDNFPQIPTTRDRDRLWSITMDPFQAAFALDKCLKTAGSQKDYIIYNSICVGSDPNTGNLAFYSTDNVSLSKYQIEAPVGEDAQWVLTTEDFAKAVSLMVDKLANEDDNLTIVVNGNFIKAQLGEHVVIARLISGTPPDYNEPIDQYMSLITEDHLTSISSEMRDCVNRVKNLTPNGAVVNMEVSGNRMWVSHDKVNDSEELPEQVKQSSTVVSVDRLNKALAAGDFMAVLEDCVVVLNGPPGEESYCHLITASK